MYSQNSLLSCESLSRDFAELNEGEDGLTPTLNTCLNGNENLLKYLIEKRSWYKYR